MKNLVGRKIQSLRQLLQENQAEFGDRFGVEQATVSRWESGMPVQRKHQTAIADLAGLSVGEFFYSDEAARVVPIVGYVSAGESFTPATDGASPLDYVTFSFGDADKIGVRVRGDSMSPVYRDGDVIIAVRMGRRDLAQAIGKDCIVKTMEGEGYVKKVLAGSARGTYRLRSYNPLYEDIVDVNLEWAAAIRWINRRP